MIRKIGLVPFLAWCFCVGACKGDSGGGSDATEVTAGDASASDASSSSPTGGELSHEVCDRYVRCVAATLPDALPPILAGFGEDGTCWQGGAEAAKVCIEGCRTGLKQYHEAYPEELDCYACLSKEECEGEGEFCSKGGCTNSVCGDQIVQVEEVCDGQSMCDPDCQGPARCNPATGWPCGDGAQCIFDISANMQFKARCLVAATNPIAVNGDCSVGSGDMYCGPGLRCLEGAKLPASCAFEYCCTPFCELSKPGTCPAGSVCKFYQSVSPDSDYVDEGLSDVGVCVAA